VVTDHETPFGTVSQYDLTLDDRHVSHSDAGAASEPLDVVACVGFAPDGRDNRLAQLHHGDSVEVYHADERRTTWRARRGFETVRGDAFEGSNLLAERPPITRVRDRRTLRRGTYSVAT